MIVARGRLAPWGGPLPGPVGAPLRRWQERRGWLLTLHSADGLIGQGEASPLPGYSGETLEACAEALQQALGRLPLAIDPETPADSQVASWSAPAAPAPAARMALETALFDLLGKSRNVSVAALLSPAPPAGPVPLAAFLPGETAADVLAQAAGHQARGIATYKLKIAGPEALDDDLRRLAALREAWPGARLRLDANGLWNPADAPRFLEALAPLGLEFVEQPVSPAALRALTASPVPLAADESLQIEGELDRLSKSPACRRAVIKPMALGGLTASRRLARRAAAAGWSVVVTHLFDGPLGLAAAAELALALDPPPLACGLVPHGALAAFPRRAFPQLGPSAVVPHAGPGLGLPVWDPA